MKKALLIASLALIGGSVWGQELVTTQHHATKQPPAKIIIHPAVDGAVQKAIRTGNPLQMINPFAPREYGDGSECVYHDESDHFQDREKVRERPKGIRLFAFTW